MAGELVPLVMLPRFTTVAGATTFLTIAMDVTEFDKAILNVWRGPMPDVGDTFELTCQESTDQVSWSDCDDSETTWPFDPTANTEDQAIAPLKKRWFRVKLALTSGAGYPIVSCWAVGFLEERMA